MPSVGDIFVSLGFNVDDKKLKEFDGSVRNLSTNMLGTIAAVTGGVYALERFASNSMNSAASLQSIAAATGLATDYIQAFGIAFNKANPSVSIEAADNKLAAFAKNLGLLKSGMGGNSELFNRLSIVWQGKTPEQLIQEIATAIQNVPRVQADALLSSAGLSDSILLLQEIQKNPNYIQDMGSMFAVPPEDLQSLLRASELLTDMKNTLTLIGAKVTVFGFETWETAINKAEVALVKLQGAMAETLAANNGSSYKEGSFVESLAYTGQAMKNGIMGGTSGIADLFASIPQTILKWSANERATEARDAAALGDTTVTVTVNGANDPQETARVIGEHIKRAKDQRSQVRN